MSPSTRSDAPASIAGGEGVISPYFTSSPLRRSRRKASAAAAAATLVTAALLPSSSAAGSFAPSSRTLAVAPRTPSAPKIYKRTTASVTPSPDDGRASRAAPAKKKAKQGSKSPPSRAKGNTQKPAPVTNSFEPLWSKLFTPPGDSPVPVHTLLLGTHPSIASLSQQQYYGHPMNAFWWIAGDGLGFRRARAVSPSTGKPYKFSSELRYSTEHIIPYEEQVEKIALSGFAMWDVVASCQRPGSLDQDIRNEKANTIREFCDQHKETLQRIVLCNGGSGSNMFVRHFKDWLESGELQALADHEASEKAFGKAIQRGEKKRQKVDKTYDAKDDDDFNKEKIVLISALSVSPAAAGYTYKEKRDFWDVKIYQPGLRDYQANLKAARSD